MLARGRLILLWISIAAVLAAIAFAQSGDAEITGIVKDPTGTPIAHAALTLTNLDSGVARSVVSDSDGRYRFFAIPPGRYGVKAEAVGFKTESITGMVLNIGTHLDRDIGLTVGSVQEAITVTGDVPPVDTTKGDVSGVVTNQQIDTLPVNTRQYLNLALLMPGTTQAASRTFYNNVQIGGGDRFYANGFTVDGVTNTWAEQGEPRQNFPEGSVQEFKVNTNQWKAEQGWAMGGVVNVVTKRGTNQFHGDAFEYWRNQALNRDNAFQKQAEQNEGIGKAPFLRNQFGGDVGGPIVRNKLHFYTSYERTQTKDTYTIFVTPSAAQYYAADQGVFTKPSHDQMVNFRLDYQIDNNQHLFGRYSQEWNLQTWQGCGGTSESNCYDGLIPRHAVVIGHTWTPSATMVNDFRFQYSYSAYLLGPSGEPIFTDLGQYPASRIALLQPVYSFPSFRYGQGYGELGIETRWEFKDDFNLVRGAHSLKWGFDFSHVPFADDTVTNYQGTWTFSADQVFNPKDPATIANLKNPTQFTAAIPGLYTSVPVSQYSAYVQDDWRVRKDLTLSLGLRWDREIGSFNESLNPGVIRQTHPVPGRPGPARQAVQLRPALRACLERGRHEQGCSACRLRHLLQQYPDAAKLPGKPQPGAVQRADSQSGLSESVRRPEPERVLLHCGAHGHGTRQRLRQPLLGTVHARLLAPDIPGFLDPRGRHLHAHPPRLAHGGHELSGQRCSPAHGLGPYPRSQVDLAVQIPRCVHPRREALGQALSVPGLVHACLRPRR